MEDACLGLCFEVHRAVKCGYFFLDDTDPDSMKDFGEPPTSLRARVTLVTGTELPEGSHTQGFGLEGR